MDLDPQLLRVLRAVADAGSITGAAERLGYSQPAVSQLLRRAETRLGHALVLRGGRGATLTGAGRVLADHAVHVQAALTAAAEDLAAVGGLAGGTVRIAGFPSASSTVVPTVLARLAADAPGLVAGYVECEPPEALDLLRQGGADVALTFVHDGGDVPDAAFRVEQIGTDPLALVTPTATATRPGGTVPVAPSAPVDLAAFRDAPWIGGCPRCRGHLLASCAASGFSPSIVLETDNAAAVVGMVAAGLGVALLPRLALLTTVIPQGVDVTAADPALARRLEVVVPRGAERIPSVRAALGAIRGAAAALA